MGEERSEGGAGDDRPVAMAIAAHPDDIEFLMAGTLLRLGEAGFQLHYLNIASGSCGSLEHGPDELRAIREAEGRAAAVRLGATFHPSLADDLEVFFEEGLLRKVAAAVRLAAPDILLAPSPADYMEDHMNACRLAVTGAFVRCIPNFRTDPERSAVMKPVVVYHAMPHGLRDPLRRRVVPGLFVDTSPVHDRKLAALAEHKSQQTWLSASQKMNSYLQTADDFSREVGALSGRFAHAEGWRRRLHYGFGSPDADPLADALGPACLVDQTYEAGLQRAGELE